MKQRTIGQSVTRSDVLDKVTGKMLFPGDLYMEGMLYAKVLWSERPHAKLLSIDTTEAERVPGVVAIIRLTMCPAMNTASSSKISQLSTRTRSAA